MALKSQVSMDESFVFMKRGSLRERRGSQPIDPDQVLCHIPKPSYDCLLALTLIQFLIIVAGLMAFGPLGGKTCGLLGHTATDEFIDDISERTPLNAVRAAQSIKKITGKQIGLVVWRNYSLNMSQITIIADVINSHFSYDYKGY